MLTEHHFSVEYILNVDFGELKDYYTQFTYKFGADSVK